MQKKPAITELKKKHDALTEVLASW